MSGGMARTLFRWRWLIALALGAVCAGLGWQARRLSVDPSNRAFLIRDDASYAAYQSFRKIFGSDDTIVIGCALREHLSPAVAEWLTQLTDALRGLPDVEDAHSLASMRLVRRGWFGRLIGEPLLGKRGGAPLSPAALQERVRRGPPAAQALLSPDGAFTAIILSVRGDDDDPLYRHELLARVKALLTERAHPSVEVLRSGTAAEQDAFIDDIAQDRRTFVPVTVAVIALLLLLLHGDWRALAYALAVMGGTLACTDGLMAVTRTPVNVVSSLLAPLILIVSVSATVHLAHSVTSRRGREEPVERLASVYRRMFVPCALALGTTAIGFLSLLVSRVGAIRTFGLFGAVGTAIAWLLSMGLAPVMAGISSASQPGRAVLFEQIGRALAVATAKTRWAVLIAALALLAGALQLAPSVRASTNLLTVFPPAHRFRQDTERIQQHLGGIYPLEVLVHPPHPEALRAPVSWDVLERFHQAVLRLPAVSQVSSLVEGERYLETVMGQARSEAWLARVMAAWSQHLPAELAHVVSPTLDTLRLTAWLRSADTAQVTALAEQIRRAASACLPDGWRVEVTGQTLLLARMSQQLVHDEVASVGLAFAVILAAAWVGLRSLRYALICLGVNVLPVAGLFACMAALAVPLNTATAMIASIALGLIFDNTVYFVWRYRAARADGLDGAEAVAKSLVSGAQPMIASSAILAGGFAVTVLGRMTPTVQFGALSCLVIGMALLSDLLLLPAVLHVLKPR